MIKGGQALYCKADCPSDHVKDTKAMLIEREYQSAGHLTPTDLYNALPTMRPMDRGDLLSATAAPGHFAIDKDAYERMPSLKWVDLFALATTEEEGANFLSQFADATGVNDADSTGVGHPVLPPP